MQIKYGIVDNFIDVTEICYSKLLDENIITIPSGDANRAYYFGDPVGNVLKSVYVIINGEASVYDHEMSVKINTITKAITFINENHVNNILFGIHSRLTLRHGSFSEELPEQKMAVRYLTGKENVLEIGGNIGRNSLVIASILGTTGKLVTLESDEKSAFYLEENRDLNGLHFHVEKSALSARKLIQKGWETTPSNELLDGYQWINTITLPQLKQKYNIEFDTLVLDCEGAFYYILLDFPDILDNINLIVMENDYIDLSKKKYIDNVLRKHFYRDYVQGGGWGPCEDYFFEVWKRN